MSSSKNLEEAYPSTSLNLAVLDPGVLSSTNSFTEKDYENRHTASRDIGKIFKLATLSLNQKIWTHSENTDY